MKCRIVFKSTLEFTYTDSETEEPIQGILSADSLANHVLDKFIAWITQGSAYTSISLPWEIFGLHLYDFLFRENIESKKAFEHLLKVFLDSPLTDLDKKLILELEFTDEAMSLESMPWEFLVIPGLNNGKGCFWAQAGNGLILRRLTHGVDPLLSSTVSPILRVLAVGVFSTNQSQVDVEKVIKEIRKLHENERISLRYLLSDASEEEKKPLLENIQREVSSFLPHVLLFVGQTDQGKFGLSMKSEAVEISSLHDTTLPEIQWIDRSEFLKIFDKHLPAISFFLPPNPESGNIDNTSTDIVWRDVSRVLPVLGRFQYDIGFEDKVQFLKRFLGELAEGLTIGESLKIGIQEIANRANYERVRWGSRSFAAPVFCFHQGADHSLVEAQGTTTQEEEKEIPLNNKEKISCPECGHFMKAGQSRCINISCRHKLMNCPVCREVMSATNGICDNCSYRTGEVELLPRVIRKEESSKRNLSPMAMGRSSNVANTFSMPVVLPDPLEVEGLDTVS